MVPARPVAGKVKAPVMARDRRLPIALRRVVALAVDKVRARVARVREAA